MADQYTARPFLTRQQYPIPLRTRKIYIERENSGADPENESQSADTPSLSPEPQNQTVRKVDLNSISNVSQIENSSSGKMIGLLVLIGILSLLAIAGVVLAVVLTRPGTLTITQTTTASTLNVTTALWTFDMITNDYFGVYNGTLLNGATFTPVQTMQPYIGNGNALFLNNSVSLATNQSFEVSTFFNFSYQSFTIEAWVYIFSISGDHPVLSQCQCATCTGQCLAVLIRSGRLFMTFTLNDLSGSTSLSANTWTHVAFVYNSATSQQILYLNGVQDGIKSSAAAYQGQNGSIQIGAAVTLTQSSFFNGYIDHVRITARAKSASELLTSASLMAYYSFDLPDQSLDSGPNGLNGIINGASLVSGRVNQGLSFSGSNSYFQAYGFYHLAWGAVSNRPFTIALWLNPISNRGSTIVQVSPFQDNNTSPAFIMNLIGFLSSGGATRGQLVTQLYSWPFVMGPYLPLNTWSHVAFTFSTTNGNTQYVNGVATGNTGSVSSGNYYSSIMWLQIGYIFCWSSGYISCNPYQGAVDELYIYSRELSASEIWNLANR